MNFRKQWHRVQMFAQMLRDAVPNPRQVKPIVVQFPINDVCNSGCQMCDIWQQKKGAEISPEQVRKTLSNHLFDQVTAIGINGGEPTLRKDFKELVSAAVESLPRLQGVSLITNAIIPKRVKLCIDDLAEVCAQNAVNLDVMISVDGVGDVHDRVRGRKGNFESASEVVDYILAHPGVQTRRIGCTVIRENVFDVDNVLEWAKAKGIYARFRCGIPHQRLYTESKVEPFAFTEAERFHFCNFLDGLRYSYETSPSRNDFYLSLRNQLAYGKARVAGCAWKSKGVTLLSDGSFAFCAVSSPILGNVYTDDVNKLYWDNGDTLQMIQDTKCAGCRHDYEGVSNRALVIKAAARKIITKAPNFVSTVRLGKRIAQRLSFSSSGGITAVAKCETVRKSPDRILVVGWYGTETLGDKAILGGLVQTIRSARTDVQIDIASLEPYVSQHTRSQMPELSSTGVLGLEEAAQQIEQGVYSDFVFGGGPLMSMIPQVVDLSRLAVLAKQRRSRVVVAGCGVGPLGERKGDQAIRVLLSCADRVVLRDEKSKDNARMLGVTRDIEVAVDPAFLWLKANYTGSIIKKPVIILALRDWPIHEYARNISKAERIKQHFDEQVVEFVRELYAAAPEMEIKPLCMHRLAVGGNDQLYYQRVLKDYPEILARISTRHTTPSDDLQEFASASGVLAMRFHSVVFAMATARPLVAIDYTLGGKIAGVLGDNGFDAPLSIEQFDGREAAQLLLARASMPAPKVVDLARSINVYASVFK